LGTGQADLYRSLDKSWIPAKLVIRTQDKIVAHNSGKDLHKQKIELSIWDRLNIHPLVYTQGIGSEL
jgi:hypothetical protein